jgi:hypothetical protein
VLVIHIRATGWGATAKTQVVGEALDICVSNVLSKGGILLHMCSDLLGVIAACEIIYAYRLAGFAVANLVLQYTVHQ